jgi:hypothetical protein
MTLASTCNANADDRCDAQRYTQLWHGEGWGKDVIEIEREAERNEEEEENNEIGIAEQRPGCCAGKRPDVRH